jgi:hypothetical protein
MQQEKKQEHRFVKGDIVTNGMIDIIVISRQGPNKTLFAGVIIKNNDLLDKVHKVGEYSESWHGWKFKKVIESPNEQPAVKDNTRYELSLALRSVLKVIKFALGDDMSKYQKERYDAADAMLKKHSKITDVLRTESNEQPVEQKENDAVFTELDVTNMVNMAFDQLDVSFFGRDEFIPKLINDYKNRNDVNT